MLTTCHKCSHGERPERNTADLMTFLGLKGKASLPETRSEQLHSRKLTWKPKKGPIKTTVLLKGGYMGFHDSLGECKS